MSDIEYILNPKELPKCREATLGSDRQYRRCAVNIPGLYSKSRIQEGMYRGKPGVISGVRRYLVCWYYFPDLGIQLPD